MLYGLENPLGEYVNEITLISHDLNKSVGEGDPSQFTWANMTITEYDSRGVPRGPDYTFKIKVYGPHFHNRPFFLRKVADELQHVFNKIADSMEKDGGIHGYRTSASCEVQEV